METRILLLPDRPIYCSIELEDYMLPKSQKNYQLPLKLNIMADNN